MKKSLVLFVAAILALALVGCSQAAPSSPSTYAPSASTQQGAPSAKSVWDSTLVSGAYKSWSTAPGFETTQPAKGPHGKSVQVFVDPTIMDTLNGSAAAAWPVGGMIVKDAYDANNAPVAIEFMQKTDQGWYFASYGMDGTVSKEGVKVEPCEGCHAKNSSDGVKSFKLPQ